MIKRLSKHGAGNTKEKRNQALMCIGDDVIVGNTHPKLVERWLKEHKLTDEFINDVLRHYLLTDIDFMPKEIQEALDEANITKKDINSNNVDEIINILMDMPNEAGLRTYVDKTRLPIFMKKLIGEYGRERLLSEAFPLAFGHIVENDLGDVSVYLETNTIKNISINDIIEMIKIYYNNNVDIYDDDTQDENGNYLQLYPLNNIRKANLMLNEDNDIEGYGRPFTHRDIPLKVSIGFPTVENNIINNGGIDSSTNANSFPWYFEQPCDNMEWQLRDSGISSM